MARQSKRIKKNIEAAREMEQEMMREETSRPKHKPWENIVLVVVICLTLLLLTSGWEMLDTLNRAMYSSLLVALLLMYAQRRARLTDTQFVWIGRAIFGAIGLSIVLFGCAIYFEHFA